MAPVLVADLFGAAAFLNESQFAVKRDGVRVVGQHLQRDLLQAGVSARPIQQPLDERAPDAAAIGEVCALSFQPSPNRITVKPMA